MVINISSNKQKYTKTHHDTHIYKRAHIHIKICSSHKYKGTCTNAGTLAHIQLRKYVHTYTNTKTSAHMHRHRVHTQINIPKVSILSYIAALNQIGLNLLNLSQTTLIINGNRM